MAGFFDDFDVESLLGDLSNNPDNDPEWVMERFERRMADVRSRADGLQREIEAARITATSSDDAIEVSVNSSGGLVDIECTQKARRLTPEMVAQRVLEAYGIAVAEAGQQTLALMSSLIGDESEAMSLLRSVIAQPPDMPSDNGKAAAADDKWEVPVRW